MKLKFTHILVTGGSGYCGSVLVPQMLDMGYKVTVYDIQYYGCDFLPLENPNLTVIQGDIRDIEKDDAIRGLCQAFREGKLPNSLDDDKYFNVRTMKEIGAS